VLWFFSAAKYSLILKRKAKIIGYQIKSLSWQSKLLIPFWSFTQLVNTTRKIYQTGVKIVKEMMSQNT